MTDRAPSVRAVSQDTDRGVWCEISSGNFAKRAALFLDRDGVIVEDTHYLGRAEDMRVLPGAAEAIAQCNRLGVPVVVVSNQSGIARGFYDWEGFGAVQAALNGVLAGRGGHLDAVLACAYHADGNAPLNVTEHPWRKPNPGMILAAGERMGLDLSRSWIVGDRSNDLAAGRNAGLRGGVVVVATGHDAERDAAKALGTSSFAVEFSASLAEAVSLLTSRFGLGAGTF